MKGLKQEEEELLVNRNRLCTYLRKDLVEFSQEVNNEVEGYIAPSVIKDLLEQLSGLIKRFLEIKLMSDVDPDITPIPFTEEDSVDGSTRTISLPVGQFMYRIKRKLLELKDQVQDKKREEENRQKILLTEGLRLGPGRLKLIELENRSVILPYQERYEYVRDELQRRKIPDWKNHLLVMVKESLKQKQDIESCL